MAGINYNAVATGIQSALTGAASLAGVTVVVEERFPWSVEMMPWIGIYFDRRDAPADLQSLTAGSRTRLYLSYRIVCVQHSIQGLQQAINLRNTLLSNAEVALITDRTLGGNVSTSWLEGGDLDDGQAPDKNWMAVGEILLTADATLTT